MRIAGMTGSSILSGISAGYSVMSVHGNPRSMQAVDAVSNQSRAAGPLVIAAKSAQEEEKTIRSKQTMTAAGHYKELTEQMRNGRMMQTQIQNRMSDEASVKADRKTSDIPLEASEAQKRAELSVDAPDTQTISALSADASDMQGEQGTVISYRMLRAMEAYGTA